MDSHQAALQDFRSARLKANLQSVLARLSGRQPSSLLSYDEVRRRLRGVESAEQRREEVPLDAIVGSVGRYSDFNRAFLPLRDSNQQRWTGVRDAMWGQRGVPPIEVYKIGEVYFVKDGNHRVSVARQQGLKFLEAYVTEVKTSVPVEPDLQPDDLIIKEEYADFLEQTNLHRLRPDSELSVSVPGQYEKFLEHISVHRYYMGLDEDRPVPYEEAVIHWFDTIYTPIADLVRERGLLQDFPGRTPADLYIWLTEYQAELEQALGWSLTPKAVTQGVGDRAARIQGLLEDTNPTDYLLSDILVTVPENDKRWDAVTQALLVAKREGARLYGLHVVPDTEAGRSETVMELKKAFDERCAETGVEGQFAVEAGNVVAALGERSRWVDIVVANLAHPPATLGLQSDVTESLRPSSGFPALLRRVPRPVLAVPEVSHEVSRALLAYDGSQRADIALFVSAYLAQRWGVSLEVLTVRELGKSSQKMLERAQGYLERHGVEASYHFEKGSVVPLILETLEAQQADLLIVGSYEFGAVLEPFLGGTLDSLLRQVPVPLLICQ